MQVRWSWLLAALMPMLGGNTEGRKAADGPPHRVVGYFAEWGIYQRKYLVTDIPAAKLTHVNYAFARIVDGKCAIVDAYAAVDRAYPGDKWDPGEKRGNFKQLTLLRKKHPHLKTLISVGGWTLSGPFSDTALTEQSRQKFAASCVAFMLEHGFDGVDVDWEYPGGGGLESNKTRPEDGRNFSSLLAELRRLLDQQGVKDKRKYLLTIAAPAGPGTYKHIEIDKIHRHLDWINLMTYDFHGSWSELTNFSAPLYPSSTDPTKDDTIRKQFNADSAVKAYLAAGVPKDKLVLGVPFYGRGWGGVKNVNNGLYQPHAPQPPPGTWEAGNWDYKDLAEKYVPKMRRFWHAEARCPWLYDDRTGLMISYDDPESMQIKAEYVRDHGLGGVMFWELSGDTRQHALVDALHRGLAKKKN